MFWVVELFYWLVQDVIESSDSGRTLGQFGLELEMESNLQKDPIFECHLWYSVCPP